MCGQFTKGSVSSVEGYGYREISPLTLSPSVGILRVAVTWMIFAQFLSFCSEDIWCKPGCRVFLAPRLCLYNQGNVSELPSDWPVCWAGCFYCTRFLPRDWVSIDKNLTVSLRPWSKVLRCLYSQDVFIVNPLWCLWGHLRSTKNLEEDFIQTVWSPWV